MTNHTYPYVTTNPKRKAWGSLKVLERLFAPRRTWIQEPIGKQDAVYGYRGTLELRVWGSRM